MFNLIPIPPLDGSKVIGYFTPAGVDRWFARNAQIVRIVFLVLLFTGILSYPMSVLDGWIYRFLSFATSWIPHFFG